MTRIHNRWYAVIKTKASRTISKRGGYLRKRRQPGRVDEVRLDALEETHLQSSSNVEEYPNFLLRAFPFRLQHLKMCEDEPSLYALKQTVPAISLRATMGKNRRVRTQKAGEGRQ